MVRTPSEWPVRTSAFTSRHSSHTKEGVRHVPEAACKRLRDDIVGIDAPSHAASTLQSYVGLGGQHCSQSSARRRHRNGSIVMTKAVVRDCTPYALRPAPASVNVTDLYSTVTDLYDGNAYTRHTSGGARVVHEWSVRSGIGTPREVFCRQPMRLQRALYIYDVLVSMSVPNGRTNNHDGHIWRIAESES
jgi:hypothetical protein